MIGVMMNTRALMELIVINLGYDLGIIPQSVFFMLVLMAVLTTYVTAPVLRRLVRACPMSSAHLSAPR
jgi:Kef-type K+ transport system membrane component KefB